ncbi:MAG TPA: acetoin utilization protein AcuC [Thermoplasmata archaeon]|nr:acetoin utilization protein AcuC [Thermoplasmata archaeon]
MTAVRAHAVWTERFLDYNFGPFHPFSERSRGLAAQLLRSVSSAAGPSPLEWSHTVDVASRPLLETFHTAEYLDFVEKASGSGTETFLDAGDTPAFPGCFEAAARLVRGAVDALDYTVEHRRPAFHLAGGLHHAHPGRASGFCIFNDAAIAVARGLRQRHRVAYIDIDAHHGDGVMYGFYESGRVLDIDFHQDGRTLFPGTGFPHEVGRDDGAGLKANVPLPPGAGDEALLPIFRRIVPPLLRWFRPDVIVLQHGVDGHFGDELAQLQYSPAAYAEIDRTVLALAHELTGGRLLVTGGGGYRPESVSRVLARTGLILAGLPIPEDATKLPEPWREEFSSTFGTQAPDSWVGPATLDPSPWSADAERRLIGQLEAKLGERFPPV